MSGPDIRSARLETIHGSVEIHVFEWFTEAPYVLLKNAEQASTTPLLRIQAQCLTSTVFRSTMCDCADQIDSGVRMCAGTPGSMFVYLPQEGRGHGLLSKVEIMSEMNRGMSLEQAQSAVGRPNGLLSYDRVPHMLAHVGGTDGVYLVTTSQEKLRAVRAAGVVVVAHGAAHLP